MAKKIRRVGVGKRLFGFKYGSLWLAIKEYPRKVCECGDSEEHHGLGDLKCHAPGCKCRSFKSPKLLSFAISRPKVINHRVVKELIAERIGWEPKRKPRKKAKGDA